MSRIRTDIEFKFPRILAFYLFAPQLESADVSEIRTELDGNQIDGTVLFGSRQHDLQRRQFNEIRAVVGVDSVADFVVMTDGGREETEFRRFADDQGETLCVDRHRRAFLKTEIDNAKCFQWRFHSRNGRHR